MRAIVEFIEIDESRKESGPRFITIHKMICRRGFVLLRRNGIATSKIRTLHPRISTSLSLTFHLPTPSPSPLNVEFRKPSTYSIIQETGAQRRRRKRLKSLRFDKWLFCVALSWNGILSAGSNCSTQYLTSILKWYFNKWLLQKPIKECYLVEE